MARGGKFVLDPITGKWKRNNSGSGSTPKPDNGNKTGGGNRGGNNTSSSGGSSGGSTNAPGNRSGGPTSSTSDGRSSKGKAEKKFNTITRRTLVGSLEYIANKETIKLSAGSIVRLEGLGKFLSGNYYVMSVTRSISAGSGYTHSAELMRPTSKDSLKVSTKDKKAKTKAKPKAKAKNKKQTEKKESSPKTKKNAQRTYVVKKGDCLYNIAKKYYGDGKKYTKIYDANTKKVVKPNMIYPGQVLVIP